MREQASSGCSNEAGALDPHGQVRSAPWPWRGALALACMLGHAMLDYPLLPSRYFGDVWGYVPVFILLALAIGFGLSAIRSGGKADRLIGIAVFCVGFLFFAMVVHRMIGLWYGWEQA